MRYGALAFTAFLAITSCDAPGRRAAEEDVLRPNEVSDFRQLYSQNCSGCHGVGGQGGLTVALGNPVYLAIADDATIPPGHGGGRAWNGHAWFRAEGRWFFDRCAD
jgi:mono/diheme cytochrome c family protein